MIYLLPIILAFLYRERGTGKQIWGTTGNRLIFYVIPISILIYIATNNPYITGISFIGAWLTIAMGHAKFQNKGWHNNVKMGYMTVFRCFCFLPIDHFYLSLLGILAAPAYYYGYKMTFNLVILGREFCTVDDLEWGEFFTGAVYGLVLMCLFLF